MTSPFKRFRRVLTLGLAFMFVLEHIPFVSASVMETRIYRDFVGRTPFYGVVTYATLVNIHGLDTYGEMKKRRCKFAGGNLGLIGYVTFENKPKQRVLIDTTPEDLTYVEGINRPPSSTPQAWGVWRVEYLISAPKPSGYEIFAGHFCPVIDPQTGIHARNSVTGELIYKYEINLFASGPWETREIEE